MKNKGNQPFPPARLPFFYGWIILAAGIVGMLMSVPGQTVGVSAFTEYLLRDLTINRDSLSLAYLVGTLGSGLLITRAGKFYDKFGARIMAFIAGIVLGLMLLYLTRVDVIADSVQRNTRLSASLITFLLLVFGFWGIRFFGQGMLTMVSRNMVMKWFDKRRGMANAVLGIFTAFGFSLAPKIFSHIIDKLEWRGAWAAIALAVGLAFTAFVYIFFRDNPESCGLKADGKGSIRVKRSRPPSLPDRDYTLQEAKKTRAFWAFTLALSLAALFITGFTFHIVSIFETNGMSEMKALGIFLPASIVAMSVQFGVSYLSDFVKLKYLLYFFLAGMLLISASMFFLNDGLAYYLLIAGEGIAWGMYAVLVGVTWPRFYGIKNLGAISGYSLSWTVIGSAMGPYIFSLSKKYFNGYDAAALISIVLSVVFFIISLKADNPSSAEGKSE